MIGRQVYENIRTLKYKRLPGSWCKEYRGILRSICVTMAIKLAKMCDHRVLGNTVECYEEAKAQLEAYMARVTGGR